ncbi:hypothetical protein D3C81_988650 [compost metagenome]
MDRDVFTLRLTKGWYVVGCARVSPKKPLHSGVWLNGCRMPYAKWAQGERYLILYQFRTNHVHFKLRQFSPIVGRIQPLRVGGKEHLHRMPKLPCNEGGVHP